MDLSTARPLIILALGLVVLVGGVVAFLWQRAKFAQSVQVDGIVTALIGGRARQEVVAAITDDEVTLEPKYRYRPHVCFRTQSGRTIDVVGRVSARPARYKIGERVSVVYNPHNPTDAHLNTFVDRWFVSLMLVLFGLLLMGMGGLGWLLAGG